MEKQSRYQDLLAQIAAFADGTDHAISVLSNCAAVMKLHFPEEYFWVGFYIVEGEELILGPPAVMMISSAETLMLYF